MNIERVELGDLRLEHGGVLEGAWLTVATWGALAPDGGNAVLFPTYFTGSHLSNARMIGPGRALDPSQWFIIVPNMIGNGVSISPSNASPRQAGARFPRVSVRDNVRAQHRLLTQVLGVPRLALVTGWSMGAVQAWQWAVEHPAFVERLLPFCGSARCWPLNQAFLEGVRAALRCDADFRDGAYEAAPERGLRAFGRAYCGWAYSPRFFREGLYRELGHESLEALLRAWEDDHLEHDANDLLCLVDAWQLADPSRGPAFNGDLAAALGQVTARTIVMPCTTDTYFTLEENALEAAMVPGAELRPIDSPYGHCAGAPGRFAAPMAQVEGALRELLSR